MSVVESRTIVQLEVLDLNENLKTAYKVLFISEQNKGCI